MQDLHPRNYDNYSIYNANLNSSMLPKFEFNWFSSSAYFSVAESAYARLTSIHRYVSWPHFTQSPGVFLMCDQWHDAARWSSVSETERWIFIKPRKKIGWVFRHCARQHCLASNSDFKLVVFDCSLLICTLLPLEVSCMYIMQHHNHNTRQLVIGMDLCPWKHFPRFSMQNYRKPLKEKRTALSSK